MPCCLELRSRDPCITEDSKVAGPCDAGLKLFMVALYIGVKRLGTISIRRRSWGKMQFTLVVWGMMQLFSRTKDVVHENGQERWSFSNGKNQALQKPNYANPQSKVRGKFNRERLDFCLKEARCGGALWFPQYSWGRGGMELGFVATLCCIVRFLTPREKERTRSNKDGGSGVSVKGCRRVLCALQASRLSMFRGECIWAELPLTLSLLKNG